jgi:hypothetical protein
VAERVGVCATEATVRTSARKPMSAKIGGRDAAGPGSESIRSDAPLLSEAAVFTARFGASLLDEDRRVFETAPRKSCDQRLGGTEGPPNWLGNHFAERYVAVRRHENGTATSARSHRTSNLLKRLAPRAGFEPATLRLTAGCSTVELPRNSRRMRSRPAVAARRRDFPAARPPILVAGAGIAQYTRRQATSNMRTWHTKGHLAAHCFHRPAWLA